MSQKMPRSLTSCRGVPDSTTAPWRRYEQAVKVGHGRQPVGDGDEGRVGKLGPQHLLDSPVGVDVDGARGLAQDQERAAAAGQGRAREADELPLSVRQV